MSLIGLDKRHPGVYWDLSKSNIIWANFYVWKNFAIFNMIYDIELHNCEATIV